VNLNSAPKPNHGFGAAGSKNPPASGDGTDGPPQS